MKKIIVGVRIFPKTEVLDVPGRAIAGTLQSKGYKVEDCSYGKFLKLHILAQNEKEALEKSREMAKTILCHSLIEQYEVEVFSPSSAKD